MAARLILQLVRKKMPAIFLFLSAFCLFTILWIGVYSPGKVSRIELLDRQLVEMQLRVKYFRKLYLSQKLQLYLLRNRSEDVSRTECLNIITCTNPGVNRTAAFLAQVAIITNSRTHKGFNVSGVRKLDTPPISYHFLPHLLNDSASLRPSFAIRTNRSFVDIVIGVPTVKRDNESYLMITLAQLVEKLSKEDEQTVLIVVYIGDSDPSFILDVSLQIEQLFPKQLDSGLIEVIAPPPSYYPHLDSLPPTLGDPPPRFQWRTKQNLDNVFLMTYCLNRGHFYLMMEDDVIAKHSYIKEIKNFIVETTSNTPNWLLIEFSQIGAIGKLFKASELDSFIAYVQLFYVNMPIDWLIESYLFDRVCTIEKTGKLCAEKKLQIRPKYKNSLFQHIGLYSSLSGKIQTLKDSNFGQTPLYVPHSNPVVSEYNTSIKSYKDHTLARAYEGHTFFWGVSPVRDDVIQFTFNPSIKIGRYKFRSGNFEHVSDILRNTVVEVFPSNNDSSKFITVGTCNKIGLCEGKVQQSVGEVRSLRLRIRSNSSFWIILSEIWIEEEQR